MVLTPVLVMVEPASRAKLSAVPSREESAAACATGPFSAGPAAAAFMMAEAGGARSALAAAAASDANFPALTFVLPALLAGSGLDGWPEEVAVPDREGAARPPVFGELVADGSPVAAFTSGTAAARRFPSTRDAPASAVAVAPPPASAEAGPKSLPGPRALAPPGHQPEARPWSRIVKVALFGVPSLICLRRAPFVGDRLTMNAGAPLHAFGANTSLLVERDSIPPRDPGRRRAAGTACRSRNLATRASRPASMAIGTSPSELKGD
jgi:hypothetical protein